MAEITRVVQAFEIITCDTNGCPNMVTGTLYGENSSRYRERDRLAIAAQADGWKLYLSRSRRWYCPQHEPSQHHTMDRLLWDTDRQRFVRYERERG